MIAVQQEIAIYKGNSLISRRKKIYILLRNFLPYMKLDWRSVWATPTSE
jgi:hypothetical protein